MKIFTRIMYIIILMIIVVLGFTIYTNASKGNEVSQKDRTYAELKYIESKIIELCNNLNNIDTRNYNVFVGELSKESTEKAKEEASQGKSSYGGKESGQNSDSGSDEEETEQSKKEQKKYDMKLNGVLTTSENINWENVKGEVEILFNSIPTMTLDLYQLEVNKEDILNFNKGFDLLAISVKEEDKQKTVEILADLYSYMPKFIEKIKDDSTEIVLWKTKANIIKAYSKLDVEDWDSMLNDMDNAVNEFKNLLSDVNVEKEKQYNVNKIYIMLNEIKNVAENKEISVFLIKYKNLIDEIDNL